jgi:hypothetical protein
MSHHEEKEINRQGANDKNKNKQNEVPGKNPAQNQSQNQNQQGRVTGNREQDAKIREDNASSQIHTNESDRQTDR